MFVQGGGSLIVTEAFTVKTGTVTAGTTATAGSALGSSIFIQRNTIIIISIGAGRTVTVSDDIADQISSAGTQRQFRRWIARQVGHRRAES